MKRKSTMTERSVASAGDTTFDDLECRISRLERLDELERRVAALERRRRHADSGAQGWDDQTNLRPSMLDRDHYPTIMP